MRSQPSAAGLVSRDRIIVASCILIITALAWAHLIQLDHEMTSSAASATTMAAMGMTVDAEWGVHDFALTFVMWAVMMAGMMIPSAAPVLLLYSDMQTTRSNNPVPAAGLCFGLGYAAVWVGFSVLAALAQWFLHRGLFLSASMAVTSSHLAAVILIAAGAYQMTPAKSACLKQCQSPLGFLLSNWRDGARGALRMGMRHGAFCLGCCWALMCVLFVVGVMNLSWVAALTVFILAEKFGHGGAWIARVGGLVMMGLGVFMLVARSG